MEDSDELRWALKVVIKRQMRDLLQQLHDVGEEMAILSVNVSEGTASHFGTSQGEWFLSEQKNIKGSFLKYCQSMSKKSVGKPNLQPWLEDINATLESSITTNEEHIPLEPTSSRKSQAERMSAAKGKKPQPVYLSGKKSGKEPGKAVIKIKVPKGMITSGTSDKDLSGLVGRLLDQELKAQKSKADASDTDTQNKFSSLLEAANIAKEQVKKTLGKRAGSDDTHSVAKRTRRSGPVPGESPEKGGGDTPRSLRSGRAVSSRFLEGIASLKPKTPGKDKKDDSDAEDHSDMDQSESVNLEGAELETVSAQLSKELEQMTLPVLERLETATSEGEVFDNREIKVIVSCEDDEDTADDNIAVDLDIIGGKRKVKQEYTSDDEENYDFEEDYDDFDEDDDTNRKIKLDPDFRPTPKAVNVILGKPYDDSDETPRRRSGAGKKVELKARPKKNRLSDKMQVQCPHCGTSIVGKSNLQSHIKRVHLKQKKFPCNICSKPFWSNNARESHMLSVHTRQCEDCSEYVVESVPWAEGVDMRSKRDVICTCGSIVSIFSQFGRTKMYHDNFDEESLSRRKKAGESGTKYACGTCGKLFQKRSQCERHSLTHAGVKVFVCDHCGNQYSYQSSLSKHLVNEHGITRFICDYCGKNFTKEAMLKAHMVKVHQYSLSGSNIAFTEMTNDEDSQTMSEEGMTVDAAQLVAGEARSQPQSQTQTETIVVPMTREGKVDMESQATTVQELTDGSVQEMGDHTVLKIGDGHIAVVLHQPE